MHVQCTVVILMDAHKPYCSYLDDACKPCAAADSRKQARGLRGCPASMLLSNVAKHTHLTGLPHLCLYGGAAALPQVLQPPQESL
jgi:hypothetical protein